MFKDTLKSQIELEQAELLRAVESKRADAVRFLNREGKRRANRQDGA